MIRRLTLSATCALLFSLPAQAADTVLGAFVVNGKTHVLKQVYVTRSTEPGSPTTAYLAVLVSDVAVEPAARTTARLTELAAAGRVHAVRVVWSEGLDRVVTTPFAAGVDDNGQPTTGGAIIDLQAYDDKQLEGQDQLEAARAGLAFQRDAVGGGRPRGDDRREPARHRAGRRRPPESSVRRAAGRTAGRDPTADKRALGPPRLPLQRRVVHPGGEGRQPRRGPPLPATGHQPGREGLDRHLRADQRRDDVHARAAGRPPRHPPGAAGGQGHRRRQGRQRLDTAAVVGDGAVSDRFRPGAGRGRRQRQRQGQGRRHAADAGQGLQSRRPGRPAGQGRGEERPGTRAAASTWCPSCRP